MAVIIDGKELAKKIRANLKIECEELKKKNINSKLAVIMVGEDPASKVYVRNKSRACEDVGIKYEEYLLDSKITQKELIELIEKLNNDKTINGILLQSPIPSNLDINEAFRTISPEKDVDGFNPINVGKLVLNQDTFVSCTPYGIMKMFEEYDIDLTGKNVVILGRSNIVGKPLIHCCLNKNATVTSCHSKTQNIAQKAKEADVLISAIGKANFVTADIILADEPTGALDQKTGHEVLELLKEINKSGKTVIIVTHDEGIAKMTDRIITISDGKIVGDN